MKDLRTLSFWILLISLNYLACKKPTLNTDYQADPIQLKVTELPNGSIHLQWTALKSFDFLDYTIVRAKTTIPNVLERTELQDNKEMDIVAQINEADATSFVDSVSVLTARSQYRVMAFLNGRVVASNAVWVNPKASAWEMDARLESPSHIVYIPENQIIAVFDGNSGISSPTSFIRARLLFFNTQTFQTTTTGGNNNFFIQAPAASAELTYGRYLNNSELYIPNFFQISIVLLNTFQLAGVVFGSAQSPGNMLLYNNYLIAVNPITIFQNSTQIIQPQFRLMARSNLSPIGAAPTLTNLGPTNYILRLRPNSNDIYAVGASNSVIDIQKLTFSTTTLGLGTRYTYTDILPNISQSPFVFSPDGQYILTHETGTVWSPDFTALRNLSSLTKATYTDFAFHTEGGQVRLYALRDVNLRNNLRLVDVFKFPSLELEKSLSFRSKPARLFVEANGTQLILVGISPNNARRTMVEKINR
jgi:hypothetical protein